MARGRQRGTFSDQLVVVWQLHAAGRDDDARARLAWAWSMGADELAGEQVAEVAVRLLERLAPVTDDPECWADLPAELDVFRAGMRTAEGFSWTTSRATAGRLARQLEASGVPDVAVHTGTVHKRDVLAYLTGYGEDEIIVRWERVARGRVAQGLQPAAGGES